MKDSSEINEGKKGLDLTQAEKTSMVVAAILMEAVVVFGILEGEAKIATKEAVLAIIGAPLVGAALSLFLNRLGKVLMTEE